MMKNISVTSQKVASIVYPNCLCVLFSVDQHEILHQHTKITWLSIFPFIKPIISWRNQPDFIWKNLLQKREQ